jgi:hypothetical protein
MDRKLTYSSIGVNNAISLVGFKTYASIVGTEQDIFLTSLLQSAALVVQEYCDIAVLPCSFRLEGKGPVVKLYQPPVAGVVSVKDLQGNDVEYSLLDGNRYVKVSGSGDIVVEYSTTPDVLPQNLLTSIYKIASTLYDGSTEEEAKIIKSLPINL